MSTYKKINLADLTDRAPEFGMDAINEARFAREALGAERIGLAHYKLKPGARLGFGHNHGESEEMYLVIGGTGNFKVGDDVFAVRAHDVVYCPPDAWRGWEGGPEGMEMIAFGGHAEDEASNMDDEFWTT